MWKIKTEQLQPLSPHHHSSAHSERLNEKESERASERGGASEKKKETEEEVEGQGADRLAGGGGVTGPEGLESSERH